MMKNLRRRSLACAIVLICLAACASVSHAARPNAPKSEVAPTIKSQVEDALRVLGKEITRRVPVDNKSAFELLRLYLGQNSYIYGAAFAFAPAEKSGKLVKSSPYVYRSGGKLIEKNLIDSYNYTVQDWYLLPVKAREPVWSKPYYDEGGGDAWMITYSIPIYSNGKQPRLIGVLTSDLHIPNK
ncbi:MAG: cache domain-containing protein [Deltaproteobacteria bacterium]|nr:cache domain-containing protein [Deltaproteobacteria bacterium]